MKVFVFVVCIMLRLPHCRQVRRVQQELLEQVVIRDHRGLEDQLARKVRQDDKVNRPVRGDHLDLPTLVLRDTLDQ